MRNQDALISRAELGFSLDYIPAATDVRSDFGRQVAHSGMEHVTPPRAVKAIGIRHETLPERSSIGGTLGFAASSHQSSISAESFSGCVAARSHNGR